jgi:hypothetical protein
MQHPSDYHYGRANEGRHCVELRPQHGGDFPHEDIAHDAAADSGQHAKQHRSNWPSLKGQRLARTGHRKQRQSRGIEYQHRTAQSVYDSIPIEGNEPGKD